MRPVGICSDLSVAAATAFHRIELNPTRTIQVTEIGISMNAAPNSVLVAQEFCVERNSAAGTGSAGAITSLYSDVTTALTTTALVENSADGALVSQLHRWYVAVTSGIVWVAAPQHEVDCLAAQFISIKNQIALGAAISASCYMVWEE